MKLPRLRKFVNCVISCLRRYNSFPMDYEISTISDKRSKDTKLEFNSDSPIEIPDDDLLGNYALAQSIARCILKIPSLNGDVIAIHGAWGSGKSSVINLVLHDIRDADDKESVPVVIKLNSLCYRSEDGIVAAFFQEFHSGLESVADQHEINADLLLKLGARLIGPAKLFGLGLNLAGMYSAGAVISSGIGMFKDFVSENKDTDTLQRKVNDELKKAKQRFLVVIDDIDRLSPTEVVAIFRTIKSVGKLENVSYLLSYDQLVIEDAISKKYKISGRKYLEKIVQVSFDLPEPSGRKIIGILSFELEKIFGDLSPRNFQRVLEVLYEIVIPEMKTIRQVYRFTNALRIIYPSVKGEVDIADFIALESFRHFHLEIYQAMRSQKDILTVNTKESSNSKRFDHNIEKQLLHSEDESQHARLMNSLSIVFPFLKANAAVSLSHNSFIWHQEKRACSRFYFDTYFQSYASRDEISIPSLEALFQYVTDANVIHRVIEEHANSFVPCGRTKLSFLLEAIAQNGSLMHHVHVIQFLAILYLARVDYGIDSDVTTEFGCRVDNRYRVIRLTSALLLDRNVELEISNSTIDMLGNAPLDFLVNLCRLIYENSEEGLKSLSGERKRSRVQVKQEDIQSLKKVTIERVRHSVEDGSIFRCANLSLILSGWNNITENPDEVEGVIKEMLKESSQEAINSAHDFCNMFPKNSNSSDLAMAITRWIGNLEQTLIFTETVCKMLMHLDEEDRNSVIVFMKIMDSRPLGE